MKIDPKDVRHWAPNGDDVPECGASTGWAVKTPASVTCRECQRRLPRAVHWLLKAGHARCGQKVNSQNATSNRDKVSCARCIPRPSKKAGKIVHMAHPSREGAMCNLPYASKFSAQWDEVTCAICRTRWSPVCPYCGADKLSRSPVCRDPECRRKLRRGDGQ